MNNLSFEDATAYSLTLPWKVSLCNQGESCWCRIIEPIEGIKDKDGNDIYIAAPGCIPTVYAQHIVKLHNSYKEFPYC